MSSQKHCWKSYLMAPLGLKIRRIGFSKTGTILSGKRHERRHRRKLRPNGLRENGVQYRTYLIPLVKDGYAAISVITRWSPSTAKEKRVLDLCCYHGGSALECCSQWRRFRNRWTLQRMYRAFCANAELNGCADDRWSLYNYISNFLQESPRESNDDVG
jgi:hypothetical protein